MRLRTNLHLCSSCVLLALACSTPPNSDQNASGGAPAQGGNGAGGVTPASGGTSAGNSSGGSTLTGGVGNAGSGASSGGATNGGSTGGASSGGASNGGTSNGGQADRGGTAGAIAAGGASGGNASAGANSKGGTAGAGGTAARGGASALGGSAGASSAGASSAGAGNDVLATIHNGVFWNDVAGNRIEAHGGGFLLVNGTWYWVGEDKSHNSGNFKAVNLYSSTDLSHWQFRKAILTKSSTPTLNTADRIIERPKLTYNDKTQKFVMWLHWEGQNYAEAAAGVFQSSSIDGDYTFVRSFRPNNNMSRDDNLFKDDDGKAYFVSAANENADLMIYELTDDYLNIKGQLVKLWAGSYREAPALMKIDGRYFLVTSGATGWDPNQAKYSTATSMAGPWTALANLGDGTTFDTQSTYLIPVQGSEKTTYIFAADRWQDPDLKGSKYIWLPLKVTGTTLRLDWVPDWQLNLTKGTWSALDDFIPQGDWKLVSVDSEETAGEDGRATNAFDDSASTIWHTSYGSGGTAPPPPHEIQIDLGARYALTGLRYTPRQDKDDHGMVKDYDFYASDDKQSWGTPVVSGSFNTDRTAKRVNFTQKSARYVRFVAKSEINGNAWSSIAELDLVGTRL